MIKVMSHFSKLASHIPNAFRLYFIVVLVSSASVDCCKRNIKFNGVSSTSNVEAHLADARVYMLTHPKEFDVVRHLSTHSLNLTFYYPSSFSLMQCRVKT